MEGSDGPEGWGEYEKRATACLATWLDAVDTVRAATLRLDLETARAGGGYFDPVGREEFVGRAEYVAAREATLVKEATIEERLDQHERILERLNAWVDRFRVRIEALFDKAHYRAGRPSELLRALVAQMRADGVTRDQVQSLSRREARKFPGDLARRYDVDRRMIKKAMADL